MITFASRNVLCTKGGIPVYFQESEPGNYLAGPVRVPERGGVVKGNAWLISFLLQSWMKCLTQLLAYTAYKNEESISPDVVHFLCCCVASSVVQRMRGAEGREGKEKGEKLSLNYTRGPSVGIQRKRGTQEWAMTEKLEAGKTEPTHLWAWFIPGEHSRLLFPVGRHMSILWVLLKVNVFN